MTIYIGSRYESSVVDFVATETRATAVTPVVFYEFTAMGLLTYEQYTWKRGDRLDNIAQTFYGRPEMWWVVAEYNPELLDPQNITEGTVLRIPIV